MIEENTKVHNFVVFDCETGGIDKKNNLHALCYPITQIAMVGLHGGSLSEIPKARYESYVKGKKEPNFKPEDKSIVAKYVGYGLNQVYQTQALSYTNVTVEKLEKKGKDPKEVCLEICNFFDICASSSKFHKLILVGHNVGYDIPFLQYLFKQYKRDLSKYLQGYYDHTGTFTPVFFDTQFLSRVKYALNSSLKHTLTDVSTREGFELVDAHSAMNDTLATMEVFRKYLLSLRNTSNSEQQEVQKFRDNFKFEY